jgi:hypothetical protein
VHRKVPRPLDVPPLAVAKTLGHHIDELERDHHPGTATSVDRVAPGSLAA